MPSLAKDLLLAAVVITLTAAVALLPGCDVLGPPPPEPQEKRPSSGHWDLWATGELADAADIAAEKLNGLAGHDCFSVERDTWPTGEDEPPPPAGVVAIEPGDCGPGRAGCVQWWSDGSAEVVVEVHRFGLQEQALIVAHEVLHMILDAGQNWHVDEGVFADPAEGWTLPLDEAALLRAACLTGFVDWRP